MDWEAGRTRWEETTTKGDDSAGRLGLDSGSSTNRKQELGASGTWGMGKRGCLPFAFVAYTCHRPVQSVGACHLGPLVGSLSRMLMHQPTVHGPWMMLVIRREDDVELEIGAAAAAPRPKMSQRRGWRGRAELGGSCFEGIHYSLQVTVSVQAVPKGEL